MFRFFIIFFIATTVSYLATLWVRPIALRLKAVDHPNERKIHSQPTPRLGGVAIWLGFTTAIGLFLVFQRFVPDELIGLIPSRQFQGMLLGGLIILLVGIVDDIRPLSPIFKFSGQLAAAVVLVLAGVKMEFIGNPFGSQGSLFYLGNVGIAITIFWVIAFANIMNFIDGLDGLAAGISVIAGATFFFFALQTGQIDSALITLALAGAALGFLKHNFYPAKIFMGDSGSMFLGYMFGAITVEGVMKSVAAVALFSPLVIMGVPILDAALAILRRYRDKLPVTQADRDHLHHRLIKRGLTHKQTVLFIYSWSAALSLLGLTFRVMPSMQKYLAIFAGLFLTFLFAELMGFFDKLSAGRRDRR
jgi:UDP-GlcNAc:undecaprenyl-phosphate/decaprenyl-phosphate GlcNAc-1-phosphate transferase